MNYRKIIDEVRSKAKYLESRVTTTQEKGFSQPQLLPTFKVVLILSLLIFIGSILLEVFKVSYLRSIDRNFRLDDL